MATLAHSTSSYFSASNSVWLTAYMNYVTKAEFNRIGWAATAIAIQGCLLSAVLLLV
ncbi:MAG: hypothetical protein JWP57_3616, partial [Spirosoma sp.]|nr:hypothetical protein [Spirosoma sp.]